MDARALFEAHHASLCRYLLRLTGDADAAADAAQDAFVRMLDRPAPVANPRAWLFAVATRAAMEASRTRTRRRLILLGGVLRAPQGDPPPDPDAAVEAGERRGRALAAMEILSPKERQAVLMREEGLAQREIADALGTTTGSVGTLIARALRKLARELEPEREMS